MKTIFKHTIILFALLISFFQSAHMVSHVCLDHDENSKELVKFTDHKCNLCANQIHFIIPDFEFESISFKQIATKQTYIITNDKCFANQSILFSQLRAPPFLI